MFPKIRQSKKAIELLAKLVLILSILISLSTSIVQADADNNISQRSWREANSYPSASTNYFANFTLDSGMSVGSITFEVCSNSPLIDDICDIPSGFNVMSASLASQSGVTGFTYNWVSSNEFTLTRSALNVAADTNIGFEFDNITNPDTIGSYYTRILVYSSNDGTGSPEAYAGLAFAINSNINISTIVPPYILLCSAVSFNQYDCSSGTSNYINLGELSSSHDSDATSQIIAATNSPTGYTVQVYGSTLTSGNNTINPLNTADSSKVGSSQFGINLALNTSPDVGSDAVGPGSGVPTSAYDTPNTFLFNSNDTIATSSAPDDYRKYTVSYLVNVPNGQPSGVYDSTLTYVAAGSF
jgi:hypothetical protein